MAEILVTVEPTGRVGCFLATIGGETAIASSRQPFTAAARFLMAAGNAGDTILVMRHLGSQTDALRARIDVAAALSVSESAGAPRFVRYNAGFLTGKGED